MPKILQLITTLEFGGAQRDVIYLTRILKERGFQLVLATSSKGMLLEEAKKIGGIKLVLIPELQRDINLFSDLIAFWKILRIIKREKIGLIHTHSSKAGILGRWAAKLVGVSIIVHSVHGWGFNWYQPHLIRKCYILLEKITAKITTKLIAVSKTTMREGLVEGIGKPSQYEVIYGGIELNRFINQQIAVKEKLQELGLDPEKPVVGTVSRLEPQKAPLDFIKVAKEVLDKIPHAQFLLVGDGPLRPQVESKLDEWGIKEKVTLAGWRFDIPEIMGSLDIFVLTSLWEGLPRVFSEAQATKRPIVATDVGGAKEVVVDGYSGYLVSPRANGAMAEKIIRLLNDQKMRNRMGERGSEGIWPAFDIATTVDNIYRLYQKLLNKQ